MLIAYNKTKQYAKLHCNWLLFWLFTYLFDTTIMTFMVKYDYSNCVFPNKEYLQVSF